MRRYKIGDKVSVRLPDGNRALGKDVGNRAFGIISKISPDRRNVKLALDNGLEMLTETRWLKGEK